MKHVVRYVSIGYSLVILYTGAFGVFPAIINRALFLSLGLFLCFGLYQARKSSGRGFLIGDRILMGMIAAAAIYTIVNHERLLFAPGVMTRLDLVASVVYLIFTLEAARRVIGVTLPLVVLAMIGYSYFGPYMPLSLMHAGFGLKSQLAQLYTGLSGYWGSLTDIASTWIAVFMVMGALLLHTGAGEAFIKAATIATGRFTGGGAQIAVVASSLFGMISGSSPANVATTGAFTIPTMKRLGYPAKFAGAVEASASTGGQLMPPIMGAGAFLMAENLGIPYLKVVIAAVLPALLYYIGVGSAVYFSSKKLGLKPLSREDIPRLRELLSPAQMLPVLSCLVVMVYFLFLGISPLTAGFRGIMALIFFGLVTRRGWSQVKDMLVRIVRGLEAGGQSIIMIAAICVVAQVFVSLMGLTGLGVALSQIIFNLAGSLFMGLLLIMLIALVMGLGIPTTAAYVISSAVAAPAAMMIFGIGGLQVHLFIFYFACMSSLTPPECTPVFVAAALAKAPWLQIAWIALRMAYVGWVVPFMFFYHPELLMQGKPLDIAIVFLSSGLGVAAISRVFFNYFQMKWGWAHYAVWAVGGVLLIWPRPFYMSLIGLVLLAASFLAERVQRIAAAKTMPGGLA